MNQEQTLEVLPGVGALLDGVRVLRDQDYRLVQICATALPDSFELTYSFDRLGRLVSLRLQVPREDPRVPSISSIYGCAFLYENEMHDLFNLKIEGINVDFHGNLYNTAVKFPFGSTKAPAAKPQPAATPSGN